MAYFVLCTSDVSEGGGSDNGKKDGKSRAEAAERAQLLQRIELTAVACEKNRAARNDRRRLYTRAESCSPKYFPRCTFERQQSPGLDVDDRIAEYRRRGDHLSHSGFPSQFSGSHLESVQVAVLAAHHRQVPLHCRGRGYAQTGFVFPSHGAGSRIQCVEEEILGAEQDY